MPCLQEIPNLKVSDLNELGLPLLCAPWYNKQDTMAAVFWREYLLSLFYLWMFFIPYPSGPCIQGVPPKMSKWRETRNAFWNGSRVLEVILSTRQELPTPASYQIRSHPSRPLSPDSGAPGVLNVRCVLLFPDWRAEHLDISIFIITAQVDNQGLIIIIHFEYFSIR